MTQKTLLVTQLKDAYATEMAVIGILENQVKGAKHYLRIYKHIKDLLLDAKRQAKNTKFYLTRLQGKNETRKKYNYDLLESLSDNLKAI